LPGTWGSPLLFFSFALPCEKQSIHLYKPQINFNISQTTFINDKRHIQKCDQISPESTNITYKPHIQKYTLFQVHKCNTYIKTSLRAAHGTWDPDGALAGDCPTCDPDDAPARDAPTCDPSDPPTWFDDTPECR
jgi:hypothetical protein